MAANNTHFRFFSEPPGEPASGHPEEVGNSGLPSRGVVGAVFAFDRKTVLRNTAFERAEVAFGKTPTQTRNFEGICENVNAIKPKPAR